MWKFFCFFKSYGQNRLDRHGRHDGHSGLLPDVYVALREGYFDVVFAQGVVDGFLDACGEGELFLDEHPDAHLEVHAAVAEVAEGDADGDVGVRDGLTGGVHLLAKRRDGLDEQAAHLFHVGAVGHADGYLDKLVAVVARHVLEVLAEEGAVEECDDAAVGSSDLRALVGDAFHLARYAVAL